MFIISNSYTIKGEEKTIKGKCDFCGTTDSVILVPSYKLKAVFFIPIYCYSIEYERRCSHCHTDIPTDKWDLDKETRKSIRGSAFFMSSVGILMVIVAIICGIHLLADNWSKNEQQINEFDLANYPREGSYYQLEYGDTNRLFISVDKLTTDSIIFSEYHFTKQEHDTMGVFPDSHFKEKANRNSMLRTQFKAYIDTGKVYSVGRTVYSR